MEPRFPDGRLVGGKYHMATHTVYLYKEPLQQQCFQLFGSTDRLADYIELVLAHELGHAQDTELSRLSDLLDEELPERERRMIQLEIEENAWRYAEALLPEMDPWFKSAIIDESLAAYRREQDVEPVSA
ncbi:hypothetical protein [Paenibacillus sp. J31TS4]|uniref:hypothetical protein n=1 Tax=Paenibacillus sp. J31TS4 TaxID=2807195 RepID=UPI0020BEC67C|nr:hypothetical protein [Paenibacillus sp. J31TS4]